MTRGAAPSLYVHATTVALNGRGVIILGPSGSGKSSLALQLMALGARLVADDQTGLSLCDDALVATCPPRLRGMIEAHGLGLLRADAVESTPVQLAVDMGQRETRRLPPRRWTEFLGHRVELVHGQVTGYFPAAILQYLKAERLE